MLLRKNPIFDNYLLNPSESFEVLPPELCRQRDKQRQWQQAMGERRKLLAVESAWLLNIDAYLILSGIAAGSSLIAWFFQVCGANWFTATVVAVAFLIVLPRVIDHGYLRFRTLDTWRQSIARRSAGVPDNFNLTIENIVDQHRAYRRLSFLFSLIGAHPLTDWREHLPHKP